MQYLTTVNPYGPTTYFYVTLADVATDPFLAFAMALADRGTDLRRLHLPGEHRGREGAVHHGVV